VSGWVRHTLAYRLYMRCLPTACTLPQYQTQHQPPSSSHNSPQKPLEHTGAVAVPSGGSFIRTGTTTLVPAKGSVEPQGCTIWVPPSQSQTKSAHPGLLCNGSHDGVVQQVFLNSSAQHTLRMLLNEILSFLHLSKNRGVGITLSAQQPASNSISGSLTSASPAGMQCL
jgi:hypothetical protein